MDLETTQLEGWLELLINFGIPAIGTLVGVLLLWIGGTELAARVRTTAQAVRKYVDEPDDIIIVTLDGLGEVVLHRELDEAYISKLLTALADAIGKPPQEVAVGDTPK